MKIILKSGGVAVVAVCIATLAALAVRNITIKQPEAAEKVASASTSVTSHEVVSLLRNGAMEDTFDAVAKLPAPRNAVIRGEVASGWSDNSEWGAVNVNYGIDSANAHSGETSQRIEVKRVVPFKEAGIESTVQFIQGINISNKGKYRFAIWARASRALYAVIKIRRTEEPFTSYGEKSVVLNSQWQHFEVDASVPTKQHVLVMFTTAEEGTTLWVDDATLESIP